LLTQPGLEIVSSRKEKHVMQFEKMEMNMELLDKELYMATVSALMQYSKNVLSTKAMATYVLDTIVKNQIAAGRTNGNIPPRKRPFRPFI
jgi:hypothetical protein